MTLLVACLVLLALVLAVLVRPLLRPRPIAEDVQAQAVFRAQLAELEADAARGTLPAAEAAAARAEVARRLLRAESGPAASARPSPFVAALTAAAIAVGAFFLYAGLGAPALVPQPLAPEAALANMPPEQRAAAIRGMVERLAARMDTTPDDAEGWLRLGRAWLVLGEPEKSAAAYARAAALNPTDAEAPLQELAALLDATPREVELPARVADLAATVARLAPDRPDALWYRGVAAARARHPQEAVALWRRLRELLPKEAEERKLVDAALKALGAE